MNESYCNNCKIKGHNFYNCIHPITSVGIILFRYNNENNREYLMIRRCDSIGYIDFLNGKYNINDKEHIKNLLYEMTDEERYNVLNGDFNIIKSKLWGGMSYSLSRDKQSQTKHNDLKIGITNKDGLAYSLNTIMTEINEHWADPEWGFPKGKHNNTYEEDIVCAIREWKEETGYNPCDINILQNILPFEEMFVGSDYKSYKHIYYIATTSTITDNNPEWKYHEISQMKWKTYDDALKSIRTYNTEKINVLTNIENMLNLGSLYK